MLDLEKQRKTIIPNHRRLDRPGPEGGHVPGGAVPRRLEEKTIHSDVLTGIIQRLLILILTILQIDVRPEGKAGLSCANQPAWLLSLLIKNQINTKRYQL